MHKIRPYANMCYVTEMIKGMLNDKIEIIKIQQKSMM